MNRYATLLAPLEVGQQVQDRGLDRHVERRGRLVADDDPRVAGERARDRDALLEPARQLRRAHRQVALGQPDVRDQLLQPRLQRLAAVAAELRQRRERSAAAPSGGGSAPSPGSGRRSGAPSPARACASWSVSAARWPSSVIADPVSGAVRPSSTRASVVLPLPDSPTSPSVSPARSSTVDVDEAVDRLARPGGRSWTRRAARISTLAVGPRAPPRTASRSGGDHARQRLRALVEVAARARGCRADLVERRRLGAAAVLDEAAAVGEDAARRAPSPGGGRNPGSCRAPAFALSVSRRGMQRSRPTVYGWRGSVEHLARRSLLDQLAGVQHADAVAHLRDHAEVVADEQQRRVELGAQRRDQVEHLGLDGRVERGRRLVEDQQRRLGGERHRDHDALEHAARELVRIAVHHPGRDRRSGPSRASPRARSSASPSRRRRSRRPRPPGARP